MLIEAGLASTIRQSQCPCGECEWFRRHRNEYRNRGKATAQEERGRRELAVLVVPVPVGIGALCSSRF